MGETVRILLVSGSTRGASTNTAALRTARALAPQGVQAVLYTGLAGLPAFTPDLGDDEQPVAVAELRAQLTAADAVLFCTPEYAGALPGSFKNLLDWTVGGGELYGRPVAWVNVAAPGRGLGAQAELTTVLGYVCAEIIQPACVSVPVTRDAVHADGTVTDEAARAALSRVLRAIVDHLSLDRRGSAAPTEAAGPSA